jgi:hypothetical protein
MLNLSICFFGEGEDVLEMLEAVSENDGADELGAAVALVSRS